MPRKPFPDRPGPAPAPGQGQGPQVGRPQEGPDPRRVAGRDRPDRQGPGRAPQPSVRDGRPDRPDQASPGARHLGLLARGRGRRPGPGGEQGAAAPRDPPADLPRADEQFAVTPEGPPGRLPGAQVQLQPPGLGGPVRRVGRARPGRLDRGGLRGGQPPARPVRDRPPGELDRRPDRRHPGHVRPAPRPEDPRRGPAPGPALPDGQGGMGRHPPGLLQGPGDLAMPELAGEEPPAGHDGRRRLLGRGRRHRPEGPPGRRHRQPARRRSLRPANPGREHRGPGQQHDPIRRDRRARRAADRGATRPPSSSG